MSRIRLLAVLLALGLTAGCKAQNPSHGSPDPTLNRRIEVMVRSQYNLPPYFDVTIGARTPSQFTGYDALPVTLSHGANTHTVDFLISSDGKRLAHLDSFDLTSDPASAINVAGRPVRGNPAAKVTVISFDDLQCPYCSRMHEALFPATLERYKDKVRFIYKDFPLIELHPWALHAAVDANCLGAQNNNAYWTYVDYIHAHGSEVSGDDRNVAKSLDTLNRIARQQATLEKLDTARLDACMTRQDETEVRASLKEALSLGLEGAPALFINGERIGGAVPADQLWMSVDRALRAAGEQPPAPPAAQAQPAVAPTVPVYGAGK